MINSFFGTFFFFQDKEQGLGSKAIRSKEFLQVTVLKVKGNGAEQPVSLVALSPW